MSAELKNFCHEKGNAASRTTSYNPAENCLVEKNEWNYLESGNPCTRIAPTACHSMARGVQRCVKLHPLAVVYLYKLYFSRDIVYVSAKINQRHFDSKLDATPGPVLLKRFARAFKV